MAARAGRRDSVGSGQRRRDLDVVPCLARARAAPRQVRAVGNRKHARESAPDGVRRDGAVSSGALGGRVGALGKILVTGVLDRRRVSCAHGVADRSAGLGRAVVCALLYCVRGSRIATSHCGSW